MKEQEKIITRRRFLGTAGLGMAGMAVLPNFISSCGKKSGDSIRIGFIGMGRQAMYLLNGFMQIEGTEVVAGCDVYGIKRKRFEKRVTDFYKKVGRVFTVDTYEKFEDLL